MADLGQQWEKVSLTVRRMSSDCRDRYRNHIANREVRVAGKFYRIYYDKRLYFSFHDLLDTGHAGHWTKNEEDELTRIVTEMTVQQGKDLDDDVFWGKVSDHMGNRRGRQQCRIKWYVANPGSHVIPLYHSCIFPGPIR